jgi:hypothetical protein
MDAGEKELRKAFEDVTTNNVKAVFRFFARNKKFNT